MMYLKRTFNTKRVNEILSHPSIADWLCDDNSKGYQVAECESQYWLGVFNEHGNMDGVLLLIPQNSVTVDLHTCLLPNLHGAKAIEIGKMLFDIVFQDYKKIVTSIPANNRHAELLARRLGFQLEGVNRQSFLKNNILLDQKMMGITHEEYVCQQQQQSPR